MKPEMHIIDQTVAKAFKQQVLEAAAKQGHQLCDFPSNTYGHVITQCIHCETVVDVTISKNGNQLQVQATGAVFDVPCQGVKCHNA